MNSPNPVNNPITRSLYGTNDQSLAAPGTPAFVVTNDNLYVITDDGLFVTTN